MRAHREVKTTVKVGARWLYARATEGGVFLRQEGRHQKSAEFVSWDVVFRRAKSGRLAKERNERRRYKRIMRKLKAGEDTDGKALSQEDMFFIAHYHGVA